MEKFPVIYISGTPFERGYQHGSQLKDRISQAIKFYKKIFGRSEEEIFRQAMKFKSIIEEANKDFIEEIEGIAEGAKIAVEWVYALNARSEIITTFVTECTAVFSQRSKLLAQNWDWAQELEGLAVIMQLELSPGKNILMMTEPGIIGKIGLNSFGIGVTLNFLHAPGKLQGLPIHIMLRLLLEQENFLQAVSLARKYSSGKGGNIILSHSSGQYVNFEFGNDNHYELSEKPVFIHTNHYLGDESLNKEKEKLASSLSRYARSSEFIQTSESLNLPQIKSLLQDQENKDLPICRPYVVDEEIGNVGTVCSIIMDLENKSLYYTPGNPFENEYKEISL